MCVEIATRNSDNAGGNGYYNRAFAAPGREDEKQ